MTNLKKNYSEKITNGIKTLPYFRIGDLNSFYSNVSYLKRFLSRLKKRGKIITLKRGIYVSVNYLNQIKSRGVVGPYNEFVANTIYQPSYLSCEYVLEKYGVMSETVMVVTSVSTKKTNKFSNELESFKYYSIKKELFTGFEIKQTGDFSIAEASLAKALFDFLYFRKSFLNSLSEVKALRLNLENLKRKDWQELKQYIKIEDSKKMQKIYNYLIKLYE
jgi:predicted transcriptional regulator of viral defense system